MQLRRIGRNRFLVALDQNSGIPLRDRCCRDLAVLANRNLRTSRDTQQAHFICRTGNGHTIQRQLAVFRSFDVLAVRHIDCVALTINRNLFGGIDRNAVIQRHIFQQGHSTLVCDCGNGIVQRIVFILANLRDILALIDRELAVLFGDGVLVCIHKAGTRTLSCIVLRIEVRVPPVTTILAVPFL